MPRHAMMTSAGFLVFAALLAGSREQNWGIDDMDAAFTDFASSPKNRKELL